jgi:uncharacterized protein with FMN-binding domain
MEAAAHPRSLVTAGTEKIPRKIGMLEPGHRRRPALPSPIDKDSMTNPRARTAIATFAGLTLLGALAGCSSVAAVADPQNGSGTSGDVSSTPSTTTTTDSSATYKDGTYSRHGTYNSPGGPELINVELKLKNNIVTAVTVKTIKADPTAHEYEELFENGIAKVVVGKKINSLNVSRVAGSSLTSMGFNDALAAIKADARN